MQFGGEGEAGHLRHFNVSDDDVGSKLRDGGKRGASVAGLGYYDNIGFGFKQGSESTAHHTLIFHEQHANFSVCVRELRHHEGTASEWIFVGSPRTMRVPCVPSQVK